MNCTLSTLNNMSQGCPKNIGSIKHLILSQTDPGAVAISDLNLASYMDAQIISATPFFILKDLFATEPTNDEPIVQAGDTRSKIIGQTTGTDKLKYEYSQCMAKLKEQLKLGADFWVMPVTTKGLYKGEHVTASTVRFVKAKIEVTEEKATASTDDLMVINVTEYNSQYESRYFDGLDIDTINQLTTVNLEITGGAVNSGTTIELTATGCDYTTEITDLIIGAPLTAEFKVYEDGVEITDITFAAAVGNVYTGTSAALGVWTTGGVLTAKYNDPSVTTQLYASNIASAVVV